jgi:hypothetical protein
MHTTIIGGQAALDKYRADMAWAKDSLRRCADARAARRRTLLDYALPVRPIWRIVQDRIAGRATL